VNGEVVTFEDRRIDNRFHFEFSYIESGCVDGLEMVDITLIDQQTQASLSCKLKVWRDGPRFCVAER